MVRAFTILSTGSLNPPDLSSAEAGSCRLDIVPFIRIAFNTDEATQKRILAAAGRRQTVIFTSANAVQAVTNRLTGVPDWEIYGVGGETRKRIHSYFGAASLRGFAMNSGLLAAGIIRENRIKQAIFFCGDQRRDELPHEFKKNGILLEEVVVYETQLTPTAIAKQYDAILFFSPTGVNSFFSVNRPSSKAILFALGETTAAELKRRSKNEILISPKPDKQSLLEMALDYYQSHPIT